METIILGGGCFWCTESVFQMVRGVQAVIPGYSGGQIAHPTYEQVCQTDTGHAEVIKVDFDPDIISLEHILKIFFATHDPTSFNRQGNDVGPQYASVIFYTQAYQLPVIEAVQKDVEQTLGVPIVTRIALASQFWPAESYHHNYYQNNPQQGYCQYVIVPKLAKFRKEFADYLVK